MRHLVIGTCCWLLLSTPLNAEVPPPTKLMISPRAIESPVMKYRLLPAESELKSGNAATILLRLPWEQNWFFNNTAHKLDEWYHYPLTSPEWKKFPGVFPDYFYDEMKRAAYRRSADWEYPIGEEPTMFIRLPDLQGLKRVAGLGLTSKARFHLSRGEVDQARETILVGLACGRHMAQTPFLITQLSAARMHSWMLEQTAELIAQPESPNLYWALSMLPPSLLSVHRAADFDGTMFATTFPGVADLDKARDLAQWKKMSDQLFEFLVQSEYGSRPEADAKSLATRQMLLFKVARTELASLLHLAPEKVAAMSDDEVAIRWYVHHRVTLDQRVAALLGLPPREAIPQLLQVQAEVLAFRKKIDLHKEFMNHVNVYMATRNIDRTIQILRVVEAVRDHLATHEGKLPKDLSEMTSLPIPNDPFTDQPFEWQCDATGKSAVLKAKRFEFDPAPPFIHPVSHLEFQLQVRSGR